MKNLSFNPLFPLVHFSRPIRFIIAMVPTALVLGGLPYFPLIVFKTPAIVFYPLFFLANYLGGFWAGLTTCFTCLVYAAVVIRPGFYLAAPKDHSTLLRSLVFLTTCLLFLFLIRALKKEIKKSNTSIALRDEFIDIASHELKNPITALKLNLESTKAMGQFNSESDFGMMIIKSSERQLNRLEKLVASMMDTALFEAGQLSVSRRLCDLKEVIQNVLLNSHYNDVLLEAKDDHYIGTWDPTRLDQVISNLLDNAIKYGNGSEVKIILETSKNQVSFAVSDSGSGISLDDQKLIFERYKRVDLNHEVQGLGLGLYLSKQLVMLHNGKISVKSSLGKGSTFTVSLPL